MRRILRKVWPHCVALYVLYHVAATIVGALPTPGTVLNRELWKDPTVQDELAACSEWLRSLGVAADPSELEEASWKAACWWSDVHGTAMRPFRRYQRLTGTYQSWQMFVAPHRYPTRLHIDVRFPDGDWSPAYVRGSDVFRWRSGQLDQVRMRSALFQYSWGMNPPAYERVLEWLAKGAAHDFPQADAIRVRRYKYRTPAPPEVRERHVPTGEFVREDVRSLAPLR